MNDDLEAISSGPTSEFSATVYLDPRIFSREAVLKASYWASGAAYVRIPESHDGRFVVEVELKQKVPTLSDPKPISIQEFLKEFCNSLMDFELRRQIEAETSKVRELILAKAFSESGVLEDEPPGTFVDPVELQKPTSLVQIIAPSRPSNQ